MRIAYQSIVIALIVTLPCPAQEPPAPLPVLPAKTDTTALRAALRFPLDPPDYRFHFDSTGRIEVLDRSPEAPKHIAAIAATLKKNSSDAERFDELRLWHHRNHDLVAAHDCAARAAHCYRERLQKDPYNVDLLTRCGEALIEAENMPEAEWRLRRAVAVDPDCWRAWFLLGRLQIESAYALQTLPPPRMGSPLPPPGLNLPEGHREYAAALAREIPPPLDQNLPEGHREYAAALARGPKSGPINPAGFQMPARVLDWHEVEHLSNEARTCLSEARAIAPHEPAVCLALACQRKLAADAAMATEGTIGPLDPFEIPENVADVHAAITADTSDPEVIAVATWFEITAAQKRLDRVDDNAYRRQIYGLVCDRIELLESIAAKAKGARAARAALLAAQLCRKLGQPFRAGLQVRFAVTADPESRAAWEAYLASLAESGPPKEYVAVARKAVDRFDTPAFHLRLADALSRADDTSAALRELARIQKGDPDDVGSRLAEATLRLQTDGAAALPRVNDLLDGVERTLHAQPMLAGQIDCLLLRAGAQMIGGNAVLGRMLLEDLGRQEPWHPRVKAALAAVE